MTLQVPPGDFLGVCFTDFWLPSMSLSQVNSNAMAANWRPAQDTESTMDTSDWRTQLQPDSRQRIVNKIMDTLKRHLPVSGQEGLHELGKIAQRFEEKIYTGATSQSDYLRKISLKMLTMGNKTQNTMVNPMQSNAGGPSNKPIDSGFSMQSQVHNPEQSHASPVTNQSQPRQQFLSQNIQNNIAPPESNIGQIPIQYDVGPNSNVQNNMFGGSQRHMPPGQQVVPQQQQQSHNSQPYLYQQQQLQQQYSERKIQSGNIQHSLLQPHIQMQQQQQPNLQSNQLLSSQSSIMQTSSVMQPSITKTSLPSLQQNQQAINVVSSVSNVAIIGHQQKGIAAVPAKSIAMGTPGIISASSPLLAKFSGPNGVHGNAFAISSVKLTVALLFFLILWLVFYC